jgi:N-acetylglutamate synthase-like GNAT family acetyltransferase
MTAATMRVRRATIEDLDMLRPMWEAMHLPGATLEPRLTEFQVVENSAGEIVGGIGFQISGSQGHLHNEAFTDFGLADASRELLWKRIQTLATNHGILRVWMRENTPFWARLGFKAATEEELQRLPAAWNTEGLPWFTLQLKDEVAIGAVEKELAMFMAAQKKHSERTMDQLRTLKTLALVVAIVFAIIAFGAAFYLLMKRPDLLHPGSR